MCERNNWCNVDDRLEVSDWEKIDVTNYDWRSCEKLPIGKIWMYVKVVNANWSEFV